MSDNTTILEMMEAKNAGRDARRRFLRMTGGAAALVGGLGMLAACGNDDDDDSAATPAPTPTPTPAPAAAITEVDVLNFALQLEYLEAAYYNQAAYGASVAATLTGTSPGTVTGGARVAFTDRVVAEYAREIANDEIAHISFLRRQLGGAATAQANINIAGDASGPFTAAARAAGVVGANEVFNPYANDENFLLGAYLLTDVGVSAYRGSARLITTKTFIEAAAGILATEAYHDGAIRATLYAKGVTMTDVRGQTALKGDADPRVKTRKISDARDTLDGASDLDQGVAEANGAANLVPTDPQGLVLGRTAQQVLNIVYLSRSSVVGGGFFPSGVNGTIRQSASNP